MRSILPVDSSAPLNWRVQLRSGFVLSLHSSCLRIGSSETVRRWRKLPSRSGMATMTREKLPSMTHIIKMFETNVHLFQRSKLSIDILVVSVSVEYFHLTSTEKRHFTCHKALITEHSWPNKPVKPVLPVYAYRSPEGALRLSINLSNSLWSNLFKTKIAMQ